jgi:hypothetical protein
MNRQGQAVECKACPGDVHSYPSKPIGRFTEHKMVNLMHRMATCQVACPAGVVCPDQIVGQLADLSALYRAAVLQKNL